jgi:hypothetical protein
MIWKIWKKAKLNSVKIWKIRIITKLPNGRKVSWNVKRYGNYERKISWIVKRFGKYRRKLWNDMANMDEMWNDKENMEEK